MLMVTGLIVPKNELSNSPAKGGGVLNALANFWLVQLAYNDAGNERDAAADGLGGGAGEALHQFLNGRKIAETTAFELGLEVAAIMTHDPLNAGERVRAAVERAVDFCSDMNLDLNDD